MVIYWWIRFYVQLRIWVQKNAACFNGLGSGHWRPTGLNTGLHRIRQFSSSLSGLDRRGWWIMKMYMCPVLLLVSLYFGGCEILAFPVISKAHRPTKKELLAKFFLLVHRISSINSMFILVCFRPVFLLPSDHHDYYILRLGDFCKPSNMLPLLGRGKRKTGWWFQMFFFHPYLGKWSNFEEHIFPMRWFNHQLDMEMVVINSSSPISNQISTLLIYCVVSALHKGKIFSRSQVLKETN